MPGVIRLPATATLLAFATGSGGGGGLTISLEGGLEEVEESFFNRAFHFPVDQPWLPIARSWHEAVRPPLRSTWQLLFGEPSRHAPVVTNIAEAQYHFRRFVVNATVLARDWRGGRGGTGWAFRSGVAALIGLIDRWVWPSQHRNRSVGRSLVGLCL